MSSTVDINFTMFTSGIFRRKLTVREGRREVVGKLFYFTPNSFRVERKTNSWYFLSHVFQICFLVKGNNGSFVRKLAKY